MAGKSTKRDPILFAAVSDFWEKHRCPKCLTVNWTYHSHSQRHYTGFYINSRICRCRSCKTRYWIGMDEIDVQEAYPGKQPEQFVDEQDGNETPSFTN